MGKQNPTWVFVAGSYRTGSTTQYQMVRDVIEETGNGIGIGYHQENKLAEFDVPGHRYVACKVFEFLPEGFRGQRSLGEGFLRAHRMKAIITMRDPRDIITSMKRRSAQMGKEIVMEIPDTRNDNVWSFKETAEVNFPLWFGWLEKWADLGPNLTLVTHYENMIENLYREVQRIAAHLDIPIDQEKAKSIAKKYRKENMTTRKKEFAKEGKREDPWLPSVPSIVYGTSGVYRDNLTEEEQRIVIEANNRFMEKFGYL